MAAVLRGAVPRFVPNAAWRIGDNRSTAAMPQVGRVCLDPMTQPWSAPVNEPLTGRKPLGDSFEIPAIPVAGIVSLPCARRPARSLASAGQLTREPLPGFL